MERVVNRSSRRIPDCAAREERREDRFTSSGCQRRRGSRYPTSGGARRGRDPTDAREGENPSAVLPSTIPYFVEAGFIQGRAFIRSVRPGL
jgi:hypothetical protein